MKKRLQILFMMLVIGIITTNAQISEVDPYTNSNQQQIPQRDTEALFDFLFNIDIGIDATGLESMVGVLFINDQYWISRWNEDTLAVLDNTGAFIESFTIVGISGIRSITTNGTNLFMGGAGLQIFEVDPVTRTLINTINITTSSDAAARMCTYDETLDGGNGGFWIGNFGSDIASVDMSGNELSVIPAATHGTVIYGGTIDNISAGGPYLWIHDQSGVAPNRDFITQLNPSTGVPTGVVYDYTGDAPAGAAEVLAGGLSISSEVDSNNIVLLGICQCQPNQIFAIELVNTVGVDDNELTNLTIFPNPTNTNKIAITSSQIGDMQVSIFNILGAKILAKVTTNNQLNISELNAGIYLIKVTQNGKSAIKKLIIK